MTPLSAGSEFATLFQPGGKPAQREEVLDWWGVAPADGGEFATLPGPQAAKRLDNCQELGLSLCYPRPLQRVE
jgi:hypothetical protein